MNAGDFIYVDPTQQSDVSEGWVIGTSHRTGCRGFLPENYTERANESDTWVKHRLVVILPTGAGASWVLLALCNWFSSLLPAVGCQERAGGGVGCGGQRGSSGSGWEDEISEWKGRGHAPMETQSPSAQRMASLCPRIT